MSKIVRKGRDNLMTVARTFIQRFWVGLILIAGFVKLAVARIIPASSTSTSGSSPSERSRVKTGRILRFASSTGAAHYGLEATGIFPYVRVVALPQGAAPVPVEVAPAAAISNRLEGASEPVTPRSTVKQRSRTLTRRLHSNNQEKPFCYPANSQSCLNCPQCCIVCNSCSPNSAGCTSCGGCGC
jgi:hypothetical protein